MYTLWLPEQYSTECRASAFAFATSVGRFAGAGITFLVGAGVAHFHTIGTPVALTSIAFLIGLLLLPFGEETRGRPLPAERFEQPRHEMDRRRLDRRGHRRAGASRSSSRDRRVISASSGNPQSSVTRSIGPSDAIDDDARGEVVARARLAGRARLERDVLGADARVDAGPRRDRLALGDVQDDVARRATSTHAAGRSRSTRAGRTASMPSDAATSASAGRLKTSADRADLPHAAADDDGDACRPSPAPRCDRG